MGEEDTRYDDCSPEESEARGKVVDVSSEICEEVICYQAPKFGEGQVLNLFAMDDAKNDAHAFVSYIASYATSWFTGGFPTWDVELCKKFRRAMVKAGALAVVAICWADRKIAKLEGDN